MPLADVKVGLIVRGRDLQHTGAELDVDVLISDDGKVRLVLHWQRPDSVLADQMTIARIPRVHRKTAVAGDGFRSRGGDLQPSVRLPNNLHLEIIELAVLLLHNDLLI